MSDTRPWWETDVPDDVRRLARACCANPHQMVLPYQPAVAEQPDSLCAIVNTDHLVPHWTRFRDMATLALRLTREEIKRHSA